MFSHFLCSRTPLCKGRCCRLLSHRFCCIKSINWKAARFLLHIPKSTDCRGGKENTNALENNWLYLVLDIYFPPLLN